MLHRVGEIENSLKGLRTFLDKFKPAGVEGIEIDVRETSDGVIVVFHDENLDSTTTGSGPIAQKTYKELKSVTYKSPMGEKIPTLEEMLEPINGKGVYVKIDRKAPIDDRKLIQAIKKYDVIAMVCLEENYSGSVEAYKKAGIKTVCGHSKLTAEQNLQGALKFGAEVVSFTIPNVDPQIVEKAKTAGLEVDIYYPRSEKLEKKKISEILALKPHYLTTKDPLKVMEWERELFSALK